ncbi:hypothetical protein A1O3_10469 [Capronia epimyces CBS 606.96]|uniref:Helicase ATP-binding domain-containing protein n=1 Tax=Capronia epimyces CBS 606.96 TaxID=1182542 RepID=W9XK17_9EURO|nr:uncharacterized protein A1O3_10469 [Capronia epimyces CBS 606.96]EXJ77311.1 hypothetical protein A1O3_10469 [Capronia epimyces CBS 606.96]
MHVGGAFMPEALVVWDPDGETLTYGDLRYSRQDLVDKVLLAVRQMRRVFYEDLCFGLPDLPVIPLLTRITQDPRLRDLVFHTEQYELDEGGGWPVRSDFAQQYAVADEAFKEALLVAMHKGSGQPARRTEFLGIRWRNSNRGVRNFRLLFDYACFILTYHKAQTRTHASRAPVRFLWGPVKELWVLYLYIVQPFRIFLSEQCNIPEEVGDYIFDQGRKTWPEKRMTAVLTRMSELSLGRAVSVQKWRQIAVAFAVKYFSGQHFEADADVAGEEDDDVDETTRTDGVTLPASFHAQATHSGRTGNRIYGGRTVNFAGALTDAGVQVYYHTSKLWWTLFEDEVRAELRGHKRTRPESMPNAGPSLPQKLARRHLTSRRIVWGPVEVLQALRRLYKNPQAQFRSEIQQYMVETVASRYGEVVVILATGGGKSLAFMVPAFLPNSSTTVVVTPLVVLKQDMQRRFNDAGIRYSIWSGHGHSERFNGTPVLFVSAEQAVGQPFRQWIGQRDANRLLDRVVFDEAHLILTTLSYRPKMARLRFLRSLRCQMVFLSATLPPVMMKDFCRLMHIEQPVVVRDRTFRPDIRYLVERQAARPGGGDEEDSFKD